MSYKTVLVHVDHSKHLLHRVSAAAELALADNAHLIGAATTGISRFIYGEGANLANEAVMMPHFEALRDRSNQALKSFQKLADELGVASIENRLIEDDAYGGISLHGRFSDLVVLGQSDLDDVGPYVARDFPEYVVMYCGRPVLIIPHSWTPRPIGKSILVAWDAGLEATHAITNAMPLLKRASTVKLVVFNPGQQPQIEGTLPGNDIALYLARHDINVEVVRQETHLEIGEAVLTAAADFGSDLIVMGAYGHSRFREMMLGGATRLILDQMTVPVLMSH